MEKGAFNSTLIKLHLSKVREREERGGGVTLFYDESRNVTFITVILLYVFCLFFLVEREKRERTITISYNRGTKITVCDQPYFLA